MHKDLEQRNHQNSDKAKHEHISHLQARGRGNHHSQNNRSTQLYQSRKPPPPPSSLCGRCGATGHQSHECRRSRGKTCTKCKKLGHFAKMCKSKSVTTDHKHHPPQFQQQSGTRHNVHVAQPQEQDNNINHIQQESDYAYIFNIQSNNQLQKYPVTINNTEIMMLIDSGATLNILDESSYNLINPAQPLKSTNSTLQENGRIGKFII